MIKVLITGCSGMLGTALYEKYKNIFNCVGVDIQIPLANKAGFVQCDLTDSKKLKKVFNSFLPDVVVHCAAIVNVDACENNKQTARLLHVESTKDLLNLSRENGSHFIYISTDSVFDGEKNDPYVEDDLTRPLNVYAKTKLEGEEISLTYKKALALRTNIFGWTANGKSFSEWVLNGILNLKPLNMFIDVFYTPVSTYCLSDIILKCIEKDVYGLYHACSQTVLSKYDFALHLASVFQLSSESINPVSINDVKLSADRPANMALSSLKLSKRLNLEMPDIMKSIRRWKENQPNGV